MDVKESKIILEQNIFLIIKFLEQNIFLIICNMGFLWREFDTKFLAAILLYVNKDCIELSHSNNYAVQCRSTAVEKCNK